MHEVLSLAYSQQRDAARRAARDQRAAADRTGNPDLRAWAIFVPAAACGVQEPERALQLLSETLAKRVGSPRFEQLVEHGARLTGEGAVELALTAIADISRREQGPELATR